MYNQLLLLTQLKRLLRRYNIRILIIRILLIFIQLYSGITPSLKTSPPPKTFTCSNTRSRKGIRFTAPFTLLLIPNTPSTAFSTTITPASVKNIKVYLVIAISTRVNIVCKRVTKIAKDIWAIDYQLSKFKDFLSQIKDELAFIRRSITTLIRNTMLLNIEFKQIQVSCCCGLAIITDLE